MLSKSIQAFNDRVAADPQLQIEIRSITSPMDFLAEVNRTKWQF